VRAPSARAANNDDRPRGVNLLSYSMSVR
jgi:hypothetical protein